MIVTISNQNLKAEINSLGAELVSLQKVETNEEFIWEGNPEFWGKNSPVLFPIVGTLKNNSFLYDNEPYNLSRHGFAREQDFQIKSQSEQSITFSLLSNEATKLVYPFDFELLINYHLVDFLLKITYTVKNIGKEMLPFSIGGHPAFSLKEDFTKYSLKFETSENLKCFRLIDELVSNQFDEIKLKEKNLPLCYSVFENDALIMKEMQSKSITILKGNIPILKFDFVDFPNFGIWTKVGAPFICLEPWVGYSDTIENSGNIIEKEGIKLLERNSEKKYTFSISIL